MPKLLRRLFQFIAILIFSSTLKAQLIRVDSVTGPVHESYLVDQDGQRQGAYRFIAYQEIQVAGDYLNDKRHGEWSFKPDMHFKLTGFYQQGIRDSIWSCYLYDNIYSSKNYRTGSTRCYYPNGKIKSKGDSIPLGFLFEEYYRNGNLKKQVLTDSVFTHRKEYNKKGHLLEHIISKDNFPYDIIKSSTGDYPLNYEGDIVHGTGTLHINLKSHSSGQIYLSEKIELKESKPDGNYEKYDEEQKLRVKGYYNQGVMTGEWNLYDPDTTLYYDVRQGIKRDTINDIGVLSGETFIIIEDMPVFRGESYLSFRNFIADSLQYPEAALEQEIEGRVYVQFSISNTGKLVEARIMESVHPLLDTEALRVVNSSPYWRPGMQRGIPVKVLFTFPIVFKLM